MHSTIHPITFRSIPSIHRYIHLSILPYFHPSHLSSFVRSFIYFTHFIHFTQFIHSIHSFIHSFIHSIIHSFCIHSSIHPSIHSSIQRITQSKTHSFIIYLKHQCISGTSRGLLAYIFVRLSGGVALIRGSRLGHQVLITFVLRQQDHVGVLRVRVPFDKTRT